MNCKQAQELLPLYVGRDLEANCTQMVTAHVQSCTECAGFADEYRETRQLLQQFAPPPFSEGVYDGIRQHVLREIGREATAPGLSRLLESLFRPRLRWAVATALLLAVSVFAFYFIASRRPNLINDRQQVVDNVRPEDRPASPAIKTSEGLTPTSTVKNSGPVQGPAGGTHQSQRRKSPGVAAASTRRERSMTAEAAPNGNILAEPDAVPVPDSATSGKTLRVEMQTKDPNIRIIWFSHQPTKQDSPSKLSKGT